jgi:hypothetical protein
MAGSLPSCGPLIPAVADSGRAQQTAAAASPNSGGARRRASCVCVQYYRGTAQRHSGQRRRRRGLLGWVAGAVGGAERLFAGDFRSAGQLRRQENAVCGARRPWQSSSKRGVRCVWWVGRVGYAVCEYEYGSLGMAMDMLRRLDDATRDGVFWCHRAHVGCPAQFADRCLRSNCPTSHARTQTKRKQVLHASRRRCTGTQSRRRT